MKKLISIALVALLVLAIIPFAAFKAEAATFTHLTNVALGKTITTSRTNKGVISAYHPINCNTSLNDGKYTGDISGTTIANNSWFAFQTYANTETTGSYGTVGSAIIDLEKAYGLHSVMVHLANYTTNLTNGASFTTKTDKVDVYVSNSANGPFTYAGTCDTTVNKGNYWARILLNNISARYVKVAVTINTPNVGAHYALLDEIEVYTQEHTEIPDPVNTTVRIGSFNIAHVGQFNFTKANFDSLAKDILEADLDIVGLQEAVCGVFGAGTSYEQYTDSLAELKARTGYPYVYYLGWDDVSNTGLGIMSRYPIVNLNNPDNNIDSTIVKAPIWSLTTNNDHYYNEKQYNSIPNYSIKETAGSDFLQIDVAGNIINFWNTHSRPAEYAKSFAILDGSEENFIMLGDMNNPVYEALTDFKLANGTVLGSYLNIVNNNENKIVTYPKDKKFMDNIFYTDDFRLLASGAVENFSGASDHFLMWAEFEINAAKNLADGLSYKAYNENGSTIAPSRGYNANLTDGQYDSPIVTNLKNPATGKYNYNNGNWYGFFKNAGTDEQNCPTGKGYVEFDLGAVYDLSEIEMFVSAASDTTPKSIKVAASVDGVNYSSFVSLTDKKNGQNGKWISTTSALKGRYVKFAVEVNTYWALFNEVRIFGEKATDVNVPEVSVPVNLALGKTVTTSRTNTGVTSAYNPIKCNASLTDGVASNTITASAINNNSWFAFQTYANTETTGSYGTVGTAIVDLESVNDLGSVRVHLANTSVTLSNGSTFAPKANKVEILVSDSANGNFVSVGSINTSAKNGAFWAELDLSGVSARYVKIAVTVDAPSVAAYYAILNEIEIYSAK